MRGDGESNVSETEGHMAIDAANNYIYSPRKFVALVGVENLVIVDTEDALLIAHRDHSQDVGKIVKELGLSGHDELI
jgi:mannose-1-phosphate guanylyltransferase